MAPAPGRDALGKIIADVSCRFVKQQERIAASFDEAPTPGIATFDLRAAWRPWPSRTLGAAIDNLFDRHDYEPGRNVSIFVKYQF